jgi:hypothetical protein
LYVWGPATLDNQRLKTSRGGTGIRLLWRTRRRHRACRSRPRRTPLQGVRVEAVRAIEEMAALAPLTAWAGRLNEVGLSTPRRHLNHQVPYEDGLPAGPLIQSKPPIVSSIPHSSRARMAPAAAMMSLQPLGEATAWTISTCRSSPPRHSARRRSTLALATGLRWRNAVLPRLPPLEAIVIPIMLGDLSLLLLRFARSQPPLCSRPVPIEDRLLRERRLWPAQHVHTSTAKTGSIRVSGHRRSPRRPAPSCGNQD